MLNIFEVFLPQLLRYPNPADPLNGEAAAMLMREPKSYEVKVKGTCIDQLFHSSSCLFAQSMCPSTPAKMLWTMLKKIPSPKTSLAPPVATNRVVKNPPAPWTMSKHIFFSFGPRTQFAHISYIALLSYPPSMFSSIGIKLAFSMVEFMTYLAHLNYGSR